LHGHSFRSIYVFCGGGWLFFNSDQLYCQKSDTICTTYLTCKYKTWLSATLGLTVLTIVDLSILPVIGLFVCTQVS